MLSLCLFDTSFCQQSIPNDPNDALTTPMEMVAVAAQANQVLPQTEHSCDDTINDLDSSVTVKEEQIECEQTAAKVLETCMENSTSVERSLQDRAAQMHRQLINSKTTISSAIDDSSSDTANTSNANLAGKSNDRDRYF